MFQVYETGIVDYYYFYKNEVFLFAFKISTKIFDVGNM